MVGLRQMARIMAEVKKRGAKLVLVGDAEQLQPIQAGAPFKDIENMIEVAKLTEIRRQENAWQRTASVQLAGQQTSEAIETYHAHGRVKTATDSTDAIASLIADYMDDVTVLGVDASRVALAHRRKDVHLINQSIRAAYEQAGLLGETLKVQTDHGPRKFSIGDRIVCTQNNRDINVRNGMLGTVTDVDTDTGKLKVALDYDSQTITINPKFYAAIEHGYATTIHKAQGATVGKSFVLGSKTMDRHLTYVALTRHREDTTLYLDEAAQKKMLRTRKNDRQSLNFDHAPTRS